MSSLVLVSLVMLSLILSSCRTANTINNQKWIFQKEHFTTKWISQPTIKSVVFLVHFEIKKMEIVDFFNARNGNCSRVRVRVRACFFLSP
jgi:hypothetical protein